MGSLSPTHWLIVIVVLVLLFGAKRLPDLTRSLGRSARILKAELGEVRLVVRGTRALQDSGLVAAWLPDRQLLVTHGGRWLAALARPSGLLIVAAMLAGADDGPPGHLR